MLLTRKSCLIICDGFSCAVTGYTALRCNVRIWKRSALRCVFWRRAPNQGYTAERCNQSKAAILFIVVREMLFL